MFEFISILKRAYTEFHKEKIEAKKKIEHLEFLLKKYVYVKHVLQEAKRAIICEKIMPMKKGCGYQEFNDFEAFLNSGVRIDDYGTRNGEGYIGQIEIYHINNIKIFLTAAKRHYKKNNYQGVNEEYEHYQRECKDFDEIYGTSTYNLTLEY